MRKEFLVSVLAVSFAFASLSAPVFSANATVKNKSNAQSVERYKKFLGKKKNAAGQDYSAQSTAGVEGGADEGLSSKNHDVKVDDYKKDLYEKPVNTIDKVIKPKNVKKGK